MRFLFIVASMFIAVVYYVGVSKSMKDMDESFQAYSKLIYTLAGRNDDGTFNPSTVTVTEVDPEEDDPTTYYVPQIPKESEHDWRYNA